MTRRGIILSDSDDDELQAGDDDLFHPAKITSEKGGKYFVQWEGKDPVTGKPWPQSLVRKEDCTDGLVEAWKEEQEKSKKTCMFYMPTPQHLTMLTVL